MVSSSRTTNESGDGPDSTSSSLKLESTAIFADDNTSPTLQTQPLPGENFNINSFANGVIIALSSYRLVIESRSHVITVPIRLIDVAELGLCSIQLLCKDGSTHRLGFRTNDESQKLLKDINDLLAAPKDASYFFAFDFFDKISIIGESSINGCSEATASSKSSDSTAKESPFFFSKDVERLGFIKKSIASPSNWRICHINNEFQMTESYPKNHIVPKAFEDSQMNLVAKFRSFRRFPSVVWRSRRTSAVLVRSSQPEVGWLGWRSTEDEQLMTAIIEACSADRTAANKDQPPSQLAAAEIDTRSRPSNTFISVSEPPSPRLAVHADQKCPADRSLTPLPNSRTRSSISTDEDIDTCSDLNGDQTLHEGTQTGFGQEPIAERNKNGTGSVGLANGSSPVAEQQQTAAKASNGGRKQMLLIDLRSYSAALANRAKGGGCECLEYYPNCEIQFMGLPNIHSIRKSFQALRMLLSGSTGTSNGHPSHALQSPLPSSNVDQQSNSWLSAIESTRWLQNIASLMKTACLVAQTIDQEGRSVLVHCSDGWDRTPQIVSLAELLLDSYYRTIQGFQVLVEREWIEFGHKFADRSGHLKYSDPNEASPVFLQWLDCVHQVWMQFPTAFEFNIDYLVKLAQHCYSCLFGTFLYNTARERATAVRKTFSVWQFLLSSSTATDCSSDKRLPFTCPTRFANCLYRPGDYVEHVLMPSCHLRSLRLWTELYCPQPVRVVTPAVTTPFTPDQSQSTSVRSAASAERQVNGFAPHSITAAVVNGAASTVPFVAPQPAASRIYDHARSPLPRPYFPQNPHEPLVDHDAVFDKRTRSADNLLTLNSMPAADTKLFESSEHTNHFGLKPRCPGAISMNSACFVGSHVVGDNDVVSAWCQKRSVAGCSQQRFTCHLAPTGAKSSSLTCLTCGSMASNISDQESPCRCNSSRELRYAEVNSAVVVEVDGVQSDVGLKARRDVDASMSGSDCTVSSEMLRCQTRRGDNGSYLLCAAATSTSDLHAVCTSRLADMLQVTCNGRLAMASLGSGSSSASPNSGGTDKPPSPPGEQALYIRQTSSASQSLPTVPIVSAAAAIFSLPALQSCCCNGTVCWPSSCTTDADGLARQSSFYQNLVEARVFQSERWVRQLAQENYRLRLLINQLSAAPQILDGFYIDREYAQAAETSSVSTIDSVTMNSYDVVDERSELPQWQADIVAPSCSRCSKTFSCLHRRHHCRNCGFIFCDSCSSKKAPVPKYLQSQPQRVCDKCFDILVPDCCTITDNGVEANQKSTGWW